MGDLPCEGTVLFQWKVDNTPGELVCGFDGHVGNPCWHNIVPVTCVTDDPACPSSNCVGSYTLDELDSILGAGSFLGEVNILPCFCE